MRATVTSLFFDGIDAVDAGPSPFWQEEWHECFTLQDKTILNGESLSVLPVWAEGMRNFLDVLRPASNDEVG